MDGRWRGRGEPVVPRLALALFSAHVVIALALIPPWQQFDEPTHVTRVEWEVSRITRLDGARDPGREAEILYSLARYDWWGHRRPGGRTPTPFPKDFFSAAVQSGDDGVGSQASAESTLTPYPLIAGRVLSWLPRSTVVADLYVLRIISAVLGALTLWVAWLGARECLGAFGGAVVAFLLALHPQFAIVSTTASPDAMVNLLGAGVWWQTAAAVKRNRVLMPLAAVWAIAIAAASTDRMGAPLLAFAILASAVAVAEQVRAGRRPLAFPILAATAAGIAAFGVALRILNPISEEYFSRILTGGWAPIPGTISWNHLVSFMSYIHQSWWFSLGWGGRYLPSSWWIAVVAVLIALAALGAGRRLLRSNEADHRISTLIALAVVGVAIQTLAVYWAHFRLGIGAQGRYFFPFLVPSLVLLWYGVEAWVPQSRRQYAAAALVLVFAVLDAAAWVLVAIPAYSTSL
jgi:hypothetical protein